MGRLARWLPFLLNRDRLWGWAWCLRLHYYLARNWLGGRAWANIGLLMIGGGVRLLLHHARLSGGGLLPQKLGLEGGGCRLGNPFCLG